MIWKWDLFIEKCNFENALFSWKMGSWIVTFVKKCDLENEDFTENAILNMWISWIMWFWTCEFLEKMCILPKLVGTPRHLFSVETAIPNASKTAWYLEVLRTPPNTYETNCSSSSEENSHKMAVSSMLTSLSTGRNISLKQANTKELVRCLELSTKKED